jgi:phosphopantothenoylcysteine decarboxylase / phosphopantothenate---cysteine ligase
MPNPFANKNILLGITGSIAAYKAADLASKLTQAGAQVDAILTPAALKFITPLTFQSVTARKAFTDDDLWGGEGHVRHIGLGMAGDLYVIAPASANTIAKLAHGLADNLLTITALAARCQILIAPAMDGGMFGHQATQANLAILRDRGFEIIGPAEGHMASGLTGLGRMVEPAELFGHIRWILSRNGPLSSVHVVVTAGGTQEPIDPVRMITNRSSGKQGYALAQAALDAGAVVTLIHTPINITFPTGAKDILVHTAADMKEAVFDCVDQTDLLIMAAAVADFRPAKVSNQKIKKENGIPVIELEPTEDILQGLAEQRSRTGSLKVVVGFAAESQDLEKNAVRKLATKKLDLIVANDISAPDAGFSVDTNRGTLFFADGKKVDLPVQNKDDVADEIIHQATILLHPTDLLRTELLL